jgi:hypothetical protein
MHTVIETPTFLGDCRWAGLSEDDRLAIVAAAPKLGEDF